jgi:hypothetical protein
MAASGLGEGAGGAVATAADHGRISKIAAVGSRFMVP